MHKTQTANNIGMKALESKKKETQRAQGNIIKAIEQGIITEATKSRLSELEIEIAELEVEISREKARNYSFLTMEDIKEYLRRFVFDDTRDINVRKLIVNSFVREVILYEDSIVATYNFADLLDPIKHNREHVLKVEKQISKAKTSFSLPLSSTILPQLPPQAV